MTHSTSGADQPEYPPPPLPSQAYPSEPVYLSNLDQPVPHKGGPAKKIIAGAAVVTVLAGGAVAAYAYTMLASSGVQPERVLPADTVAFAKIDLDPAADQKVAVYRLSGKFPKVSRGAGNIEQEKNSLLAAVFGDQDGLDYNTDIKPWLGDRIAIAAVPDAGSSEGLDPVAAVAYTNEAKMKAAMSKESRTDKNFGYASLNGYVLISNSQPHADAAVAGARRASLSGNDHYQADLNSLHGNQVAVGWADLGAATAALKAAHPSADSGSSFGALNYADTLATTKGRVVLGAHAEVDYLEVSAVTHGTTSTPKGGGKPLEATLLQLSAADTDAAVEIGGLGDALEAAWKNATADPAARRRLEDMFGGGGLRLPADLGAVFGTDTTISMQVPATGTGDAHVAAQVSTTDPQRAMEVIDMLRKRLQLGPDKLRATRTAHGYTVSNSPSYDGKAGPGSTPLGDDPTFKKAVVDSAKASLVGYLNVGRIIDSDPTVSATDKADWKHVGAIGLSVTPTPDGNAMTIRMTTR